MTRLRFSANILFVSFLLVLAVPDRSRAEDLDSPAGEGPVDVPVPVDTVTAPLRERETSWLIIPGIFNLPETGTGLALKARARDIGGVPGYVDATLAVTMKRQADLSLTWVRDSIDDSWRTIQTLGIGRFPDVWYGVGNPTEDSMKARFTPMYLIGESRLARYVGGRWAVEALLGADTRVVRREDEGAFRTTTDLVAADGGTYWLAGAAVQYEGRDLPDNPSSGRFLDVRWKVSLPGSEGIWTSFQTDASQTVSRGPWIAVVRARTLDAWGEPPFWELPFLGDRSALRGLPERRLRGDAVQCAGAEIRYGFRSIWNLSWQVAAFGEEGHAGTHQDVWTAEPTPAGGGGVRLLLDGGKAVLRIDYGVSPVGSGLYIDFGQAF